MKNKYINKKWDSMSKVLTSLFILILLSIVLSVFIGDDSKLLVVFVFAFVVGVLLLMLSYFPLYFIISDTDLIIKRLFFSDIKILLKDIVKCYKTDSVNISMTYSSKGVLGYLGVYMDGTLSFSTSRSNNVTIESGTQKLVISPENTDSLLSLIYKEDNS